MSLGLAALVRGEAQSAAPIEFEGADTHSLLGSGDLSRSDDTLLRAPWSNVEPHVDERVRTVRRTSVRSAVGVRWTMGGFLATRALTIMLWAAVVSGPIALGAVVLHTPAGSEDAALIVDEPDTRMSRASAVAVALVGAWLSATIDNPEPLQDLLPNAQVVAQLPMQYRDATVAEASLPGENGVVRVVVAVHVSERASNLVDTADESDASTWILRYFQVAVATTGGVSALAEPALVAPPDNARPIGTSEYALVLSSAEATAATLFLSAYLTGSEDVVRFTSPDADIGVFSIAPFAAVRPIEVFADRQSGAPPSTGEQLGVRVSVAVVAHDESVRVMTYWLTLQARDGRWEVSTIDPGPAVAASPTPSLPHL